MRKGSMEFLGNWKGFKSIDLVAKINREKGLHKAS